MPENLNFTINEVSQVGEARRSAVLFAQNSGFDETITEKAAIIATELSSNLVKHADGGQLLIQTNERGTFEILAIDKGAGIYNINESLRDGYSTAGSAGHGLGAVRRLADEFEIYSSPNAGTVVWCKLEAKAKTIKNPSAFKLGAISMPHPKEIVCGDSWAVKEAPGICQILVVDGLGHGQEAAKAALAAVRVFNEQAKIISPVEMLKLIHGALRPTRGAAAAVINLDVSKEKVIFGGIGNISGVIVTDEAQKQMVSHAGIAGYEARKISEFVYSWERDAMLVVHSDGLQTRWNLASFPGVRHRHPGLSAALLYRDYNRKTDDVTVVTIRQS